jgi:phosphoribosyl 1,2-cyclic phosphodiesterase
MSLHLYIIASGSKGNALFLQQGNTRILIDCGIGIRALTHTLDTIGVRPSRLDAVLITHEHSDHIRGLGLLLKKTEIPVYASAGTLARMSEVIPRGFPTVSMNGTAKMIGEFTVNSIQIPHDAAEPVAYHLTAGGHRITVATDLGEVPKSLTPILASSTCLVLESNHDVHMLESGSYPDYLKERIRSRYGHLSNGQTAHALKPLRENGLRHVVLAHLSDENNDPALARESAQKALHDSAAKVHVTAQGMVGPFLDL